MGEKRVHRGRSRGLRWGLCLLLAFGMPADSPVEDLQETAAIAATVRVYPDGAVVVPRAAGDVVADSRYEFGLPDAAPLRQWHPDGISQVLATQWEFAEIRYTQTVLLTEGSFGDETVPVLMVQISGESLASEYVDASAALAIRRDAEPLQLEYRQGLIQLEGGGTELPLAVVEVAAGAVVQPTGRVLRFRAHMPPGTYGSMTVKIPFRPVTGEDRLNDLRDLEFDDEFYRMRKARTSSNREAWSRLPDGSWGLRRSRS